MLGGFLTADDVTQMGYVASAIELMEDEVVDYFGDLTERQGAQDRILLENVQVVTNIGCLPYYPLWLTMEVDLNF